MITGPSGMGKSIVAKLLMEHMNIPYIDVNPLLIKGSKEISSTLSMSTAVMAVILDEYDFIDVLSFNDTKGLISAFPRTPFIIVVNKYSHGKTFDLSKEGMVVNFNPIPSGDVCKWTTKIMRAEGMNWKMASEIVNICDGDMRQILKWLELNGRHLPGINKGSALDRASYKKDEDIDCITATKYILDREKKLDPDDALSIVGYDINLVSSMISENYLTINKDMSCIDTIAKCADLISLADNIESYIYASQSWYLWENYATCAAVYPAALVRTNDTSNLIFTKLWSRISNMYYRIYQLNDIKMCLLKQSCSNDMDTMTALGYISHYQITNGDITACIQRLVKNGMDSDNINMLVKHGNMIRYKNTLQKKIKKEYDKVIGKTPRRKPKPEKDSGDN
jgi:Replication factor RFC1 C terminal domain